MLTEKVMIRLDEKTRLTLERLAARENRTLSNYIRDVLLKLVKEVKASR